MSATRPTTGMKRARKARRALRRSHGLKDYRDDCRALIKQMRQHNEHATTAEDRYSPDGFRIALKRLRHEFSALIAGRVAKARAA